MLIIVVTACGTVPSSDFLALWAAVFVQLQFLEQMVCWRALNVASWLWLGGVWITYLCPFPLVWKDAVVDPAPALVLLNTEVWAAGSWHIHGCFSQVLTC